VVCGRPKRKNESKKLAERVTIADFLMWVTGGAILLLIVWGSAATLASGRYQSHHWFDFVVFAWPRGVSTPSSPWAIPWSTESSA